MRVIWWLLRLWYPFICPECGQHMECVSMTPDRVYWYECTRHPGCLYPFHRSYQ